MSKIQFLDEKGTFRLENPDHYTGLYFPIASEQGLKSAVTPNLNGDSKLDQNTFLLEPTSIENLHNNRSSRNFWCQIEGKGNWSVTGQSAEAELQKFTQEEDSCELTAGFMWQKISRTSSKYGLSATVLSYVPCDQNVEIMHVTVTNQTSSKVNFVPVAAVPIYGRSADNLRDHRHVTSLLHRINTTKNGVWVKPTLSFDERGHQRNQMTYYVCGVGENGESPESFYPTVESFLLDGGSFTNPLALKGALHGCKPGAVLEGKEALGGIVFSKVSLQPQESISFTVLIGVTERQDEITEVIEKFNSKQKVLACHKETENAWQKQVNVQYHTGKPDFDQMMRWVSFQPFLRRIYGCSFLPHHDYGKGGRGWRDLWQDCLALLMMNPEGVREMILSNFGGVRIDGTNATIIGSKQGEFIADRNNIVRVWMDHGVWPFMTTRLYMDQTGDLELLTEKVTYFKDKQAERGTATDLEWDDKYGNKQKDIRGKIYEGTVLEHLLLQNLCAFYEVGEHNHFRLRGADWNDAMDMAQERGESVAFTCAYAGNLQQLAHYLRALKQEKKVQTVELLQEISELLVDDFYTFEDVRKKQTVLMKYTKQCRHQVSGAKLKFDPDELAANLMKKADWIMNHVRKTEWVMDQKQNGWFNSYYDNHGNQAEGQFGENIRMILTGQVFAIMSKTASKEQIAAICKSADTYLYDERTGGYKINTNFKEEKYDMGRMFGFAYGEKENGAVFSHMTVMYANALYENGFVKEGYKALQTLADTALCFDTSRMYPGIPEYFNAEGRGLYAYLTGAASWYMLTMITEVFGVKGRLGRLCFEPKLLKEQFDEKMEASIELTFSGKHFKVTYRNDEEKDYGSYEVGAVKLDGREVKDVNEELESLDTSCHEIVIELQ